MVEVVGFKGLEEGGGGGGVLCWNGDKDSSEALVHSLSELLMNM